MEAIARELSVDFASFHSPGAFAECICSRAAQVTASNRELQDVCDAAERPQFLLPETAAELQLNSLKKNREHEQSHVVEGSTEQDAIRHHPHALDRIIREMNWFGCSRYHHHSFQRRFCLVKYE
jgi:hypothetical protein